MIKITSISLKNFLSIGNATQAVRLEDGGLTLILGNNTEGSGTTRNGAGKTAIIQALSFVLFGWPLTKIKIDNLINNINQKGMMVTLDFEKDGIKYRIERGRKPNILKFYVNERDYDDLARGENKETQVEIENIVGMSYTMFQHIVALNTNTEPFLKMGAGHQREVIEELLGVTQISSRAEILKSLINQTKETIKEEDYSIKASKDANARIERTIAGALADKALWDENHAKTIVNLVMEMETMETINFDEELAKFDAVDQWMQAVSSFENERNFLVRDIDQLSREQKRLLQEKKRAETDRDGAQAASTINRLERDLERQKNTKMAAEESLVALLDKLAEKEAELSNPDVLECFTCGQALCGTDHLVYVTQKLNERKEQVLAEIENKKSTIAAIDRDMMEIHDDIFEQGKSALAKQNEAETALATILVELEANEKDLLEKQNSLRSKDAEKEKLGEKPETIFSSRDEIYTTRNARDILIAELDREKKQINPFIAQIEGLQSTLQTIDMTALNDAHDLLKHQDFLLKLLTNKDSFIRKKIIEQNLYYLNTRLNTYLNRLGLPHEVVFQSDLSVEITLLGRDFDFAQLSRGEMNRVIMAVSWSFRDVWESLNFTFNLIFVDEMLDSGVDSHGAEAGLQILKGFSRAGKSVFLISHRDELVGRIDRTLLVSKENGFTTIAEE